MYKQELQKKIDDLKTGKVQVEPQQDIPMEPAPMSEMTPEQAAKLDAIRSIQEKNRGPASVGPSTQDLTEKSDMVAVPMDQYAPAGSFVGGKLGQQESPDLVNPEVKPEEVSRLPNLKNFLSGRNPASVEGQPTINQLKKFKEGQDLLDSSVGKSGVPQFMPEIGDDSYFLNKVRDISRMQEIANSSPGDQYMLGDMSLGPITDKQRKEAREELTSRDYSQGGSYFPTLEEKQQLYRDQISRNNESKLNKILENLKNQK